MTSSTPTVVKPAPVVLLHGWGMRPIVWTDVIAALGARHRPHCPTLPGHDGRLPPPTLDAWADALADTLDEGTVLAGWSLGAMLALATAHRHPRKVARLLLLGASPRFVAGPDWPHGLAAETVHAFVRDFADDPQATLKRFAALQVLGDAGGRNLARRLAECFALPADAAADSGADSEAKAEDIAALAVGLDVLTSADLRPWLHEIRQTCHILHGEADALMPLSAARWLADQLPDARLQQLPGVGHALPLSASVECARLIADFADAAHA